MWKFLKPVVTYLTGPQRPATGHIIGIAVAVLVLLIVIFMLVFARATGRWCFSGSYSSLKQLQSQTMLVFTGQCGIVAKF
jgi:hypothetical protein